MNQHNKIPTVEATIAGSQYCRERFAFMFGCSSLREPDTYRRLVWQSFEKRLPGTLGSDFSRTAGRPHPMEIHVLPGPSRPAEPDL
jgi:hypothetical protein